jgi:subtilisin
VVAGQDVKSHGTHVAGLIGARPPPLAGPYYVGVAPGVTLYTARVFAPNAPGASNGDIAMALDDMSTHRDVHLVNLSLGSPVPSMIVYDAILAAEQRGTLTVCAAGNDGKGLSFPAAFAETMAITALGYDIPGALPVGTPSLKKKPAASATGRFGRGAYDKVFFPQFSNFGRGVSFIAPGVGIISTVPERNGLVTPYGAMDGTSMASPIACAAMAILLSQDNAYLAMNGDEARTRRAREIVSSPDACTQLGLRANFEGLGMPVLPLFA